MDSFLLWLSVGGAALLLVALVTAWWEHVKRLAEIREQLAWSENSRFALEAHAREVDAKLLAMSSVLQAQQHPAPMQTQTQTAAKHNMQAATGASEAPAALSAGLSASQTAASGSKTGATTGVKAGFAALAASASAVSAVLSSRAELQEMEQQPTWQDTEPMVLTTQTFDFEPTQPVDFSHH
jgi:hypothetical protein